MSTKPFGLAVRAVIADNRGRCLLLRRSSFNKHFVGQWEWPGGKVDSGETFDAAVCREVREETGLKVRPTGVAGAYGFEMEKARVAVLCLEVKRTGGRLKLSEEHDRHKWVAWADLPQCDIVDSMKETAEAYAAKKRTGEKKHV
jgi:8-oxo-dGTP diphosphatase